eukprot:TRINITY_DN7199_c0_g1_i1.p1 TRINITY_DN7199_c0_g1~~TRINITY_DN7199_c0_g1_i1.p1  ORF type:complete len:356 (-),score=56.59 TRINITY_DN7199_c0_g1_i1:95-1162(-)
MATKIHSSCIVIFSVLLIFFVYLCNTTTINVAGLAQNVPTYLELGVIEADTVLGNSSYRVASNISLCDCDPILPVYILPVFSQYIDIIFIPYYYRDKTTDNTTLLIWEVSTDNLEVSSNIITSPSSNNFIPLSSSLSSGYGTLPLFVLVFDYNTLGYNLTQYDGDSTLKTVLTLPSNLTAFWENLIVRKTLNSYYLTTKAAKYFPLTSGILAGNLNGKVINIFPLKNSNFSTLQVWQTFDFPPNVPLLGVFDNMGCLKGTTASWFLGWIDITTGDVTQFINFDPILCNNYHDYKIYASYDNNSDLLSILLSLFSQPAIFKYYQVDLDAGKITFNGTSFPNFTFEIENYWMVFEWN